MPEETRLGDGELSPFDIADWFWSFRWLAVALLLLAAIWTAVLFWTERSSSSGEERAHNVVISIYAGGTPVRSVSEIVGIYRIRLVSPGRTLTSVPGADPLVLHAERKSLADAAVTESNQLAEQLVAEVQAQTDTLGPYMQREVVPEAIAGQYIRNISFLSGVEAGLVQVSSPAVEAVTSAQYAGMEVRLVLPWITCGVLFLALAGAISFVSKWRTRRARA